MTDHQQPGPLGHSPSPKPPTSRKKAAILVDVGVYYMGNGVYLDHSKTPMYYYYYTSPEAEQAMKEAEQAMKMAVVLKDIKTNH